MLAGVGVGVGVGVDEGVDEELLDDVEVEEVLELEEAELLLGVAELLVLDEVAEDEPELVGELDAGVVVPVAPVMVNR